jgi:glycosyltransferase involved in cell wall biosynthesis
MSPSALFVTTVPITLEAFLVPFAEHFRAQGWRVDALANGAATATALADAFDHRYDVAWSRNPLAPRNLIGTARHVRELVTREGYDIVHVHTPIAAFVTRFALRRLPREMRPTVIYTAHGFHFYRGQRFYLNALYRTLERTAARWTDYLVTINAEDFEAASGFRGIARRRVRLVPGIGVDTTRFADDAVPYAEVAAIRPELGIPDDDFMLLMIAEFAPVKRHVFVLDALSRVRKSHVTLVLVGDGPLEAAVREQVERLGLVDRVIFAGYRRDIPALLAAADALVLASEREGLNRSVLEAMAAGKPVIGTRTRGIIDALPEGTGWIADKNDPAALATAIDAAADFPAEVARRGAAARLVACRTYDLPLVIHAYEELYREALASRV